MYTLNVTLDYLNKAIYAPNRLIMKSIEEEEQNSEYAADTFILSTALTSKTIRFRVAKITPSKIGQFVTFWEKDDKGTNQPFQYDKSPDLLVVTTFNNDNQFGQFVFPKDILFKKGILKSDSTKGKMGIRVYPSWDKPISKIAIKTQCWQLEYFFVVTDTSKLPTAKILALYE